MMRRTTISLVLLFTSMAFAQSTNVRREIGMATQKVTITNIMPYEILSPPLVIAHDRDFTAFKPGQPASPELEALAEDGNAAPLAEMADMYNAVTAAIVSDGPIMPGQSVTIEINAAAGDRITVLAMLIHTNDGFMTATLPARVIPNFKAANPHTTSMAYADVFDAGTEANSESCTDIPGCGGSESPEDEVNFVHAHRGIQGIAEISGNYDWRGPVATVTVERY